MPSAISGRRRFLQVSGLSLSFSVAGVSAQLAPAQARIEKADFAILNPDHVEALEIVADHICPGAKMAGVSHFVDSQLAVEPANSLLMLRYLGVSDPYSEFYLPALTSLITEVQSTYKTSIALLKADQLDQLIDNLSSGQMNEWTGPPAEFFYFVLRSDAVDVTYGTQVGFAKLDIPYMAHINPPTTW